MSMSEIVNMPKLGFDMAEGKLVRKVIPEGASVKRGEVLAEIETDKATVEVAAPAEGVVRGWFVAEGQAVPVGALMAVIAAPEEAVDLEALRAGSAPAAASTPAAPTATPAAVAAPIATAAPSATTTLPALSPVPSAFGRVFASPLARKMAESAKLDLHQLHGSGPGGRILKKDVEARLQMPAAAPIAAAPGDQTVPLTRLRQAIARRMTESVHAVPPFYITTRIDMAAALDLRQKLNTLLPEEGKISVNDLIIRAAALTLRQFPNLNATFAGDQVLRKGRINIGVAVGVEGGLLTVVIKQADQKSLAAIAQEARALIGRARAGKVQVADIEDSTFSISNLGMYPVAHFIAIINPPEAAILATGQVQSVPVVKDGAVVPGLQMEATISADHRVTDGVEAAQFMQALKQTLEEPLRLLI
jgi:pyruvate dehydrogenase E2 component (dihydrolipoamide acetyltransferase)